MANPGYLSPNIPNSYYQEVFMLTFMPGQSVAMKRGKIAHLLRQFALQGQP